LVALIVALQTHRRAYYEELGRRRAILVVGNAALEYMRQVGVPPSDVEALLDRGLLLRVSDTVVDRSRSRVGPAQAPAEAVQRVKLSFPGEISGFELVGDRVIDKTTRERLVVIDIDGISSDEQARLNQDIARRWFELAHDLLQQHTPGSTSR
jgi:hypothetical protein